jgi:hypothetical protein
MTFSAKSRTDRRKACCSAENSKSMERRAYPSRKPDKDVERTGEGICVRRLSVALVVLLAAGMLPARADQGTTSTYTWASSDVVFDPVSVGAVGTTVTTPRIVVQEKDVPAQLTGVGPGFETFIPLACIRPAPCVRAPGASTIIGLGFPVSSRELVSATADFVGFGDLEISVNTPAAWIPSASDGMHVATHSQGAFVTSLSLDPVQIECCGPASAGPPRLSIFIVSHGGYLRSITYTITPD